MPQNSLTALLNGCGIGKLAVPFHTLLVAIKPILSYFYNPVPLAERLEYNRLGLSEAGLKSVALATG